MTNSETLGSSLLLTHHGLKSNGCVVERSGISDQCSALSGALRICFSIDSRFSCPILVQYIEQDGYLHASHQFQ